MTPRQFIDDLKVLECSGVGSRSVPNGLRELRATRPYQAFYDERYFTRDAPRPQQQQQQQQQTRRAPVLGKSVSARSVPRPGPDSPLTGSSVSVNSYSPSPSNGKDKSGKDKEKKKRFLGF